MPNLPSGLPEYISDDEDLARFLTTSRWFNSIAIKPAAFLPYNGETSVSRHGAKPIGELWKIADEQNLKNVHGAALFKAQNVRDAGLDVYSDEPPPLHAAIRNWPMNSDPCLQKAQQLELALKLVAASGKALLKK